VVLKQLFAFGIVVGDGFDVGGDEFGGCDELWGIPSSLRLVGNNYVVVVVVVVVVVCCCCCSFPVKPLSIVAPGCDFYSGDKKKLSGYFSVSRSFHFHYNY